MTRPTSTSPTISCSRLDEQRFVVEETGDEVQARHAPIIFITSNDEKDLPDAFLRRCLFHYIEFPKEPRLVDIVRAHFPEDSRQLIDAAVSRFVALRKDMQGKKVSTSELIRLVPKCSAATPETRR